MCNYDRDAPFLLLEASGWARPSGASVGHRSFYQVILFLLPGGLDGVSTPSPTLRQTALVRSSSSPLLIRTSYASHAPPPLFVAYWTYSSPSSDSLVESRPAGGGATGMESPFAGIISIPPGHLMIAAEVDTGRYRRI